MKFISLIFLTVLFAFIATKEMCFHLDSNNDLVYNIQTEEEQDSSETEDSIAEFNFDCIHFSNLYIDNLFQIQKISFSSYKKQMSLLHPIIDVIAPPPKV